MEEIMLRKVNVEDMEELQRISSLTFYETFAPFNSEENMRSYLNEACSIEKLRSEWDDHHSEFYFASLKEQVVGYLKLNTGTSQTELRDRNALEIERIYVSKDYHGKKIGQQLYDLAILIAKEKKVDFVWLGVWEYNSRAIRFYEKNGFEEFDRHSFILGDDEQTDIMMKLSLTM